MSNHVLIVDDDDIVRESLVIALENRGFVCDQASDGTEALVCITEKDFDVVITDIEMPKMNGIELIRMTKQIRPRIPIIAITGAEREFPYKMVMDMGADEYLGKPFSIKELRGKVEKVLKKNKNKWNDGYQNWNIGIMENWNDGEME